MSSLESDHIKCPQCGTGIEVFEVLVRQVTDTVEARQLNERPHKSLEFEIPCQTVRYGVSKPH